MNVQDLYGLILTNYDVFEPYICKLKFYNYKFKNNKSIDVKIEKSEVYNNNVNIALPVLRTEEYSGLRIVSILRRWDVASYGYVLFSILKTSTQFEMLKCINSFYKLDVCSNCDGFMCHYSELNVLLEKFSLDIYDVNAPKGTINSNLLEHYIVANNNILSHYAFRNNFSYKELDKYGIWGLDKTYTSVIWTFDSVEKYKDVINWKKLIELSNLKWDDAKLEKYYNYIPFFCDGTDLYWDRFKKENVISDFSNIVINNSDFLLKHFYEVEILALFRTAKYTLRDGDIILFYEMISNIEGFWSKSFSSSSAAQQLKYFFFTNLVKNENIEWTPNLLIELGDNCKEFFSRSRDVQLKLVPLFEEAFSISTDLSKKLSMPLFLVKLKEGNQPYNAYSINFTCEEIIKNVDQWNVVLEDKFIGTHRASRDTYYYIHKVKTMWNCFNENKSLYLTYDLCKILSKLKIVVGGEYEKEYENQQYYDEGFYSKEVNALQYFSSHKFRDNVEIDRLMKNKRLFNLMLKYGNKSVIEYCLELFFKDYSIDDFISVVDKIGICKKI